MDQTYTLTLTENCNLSCVYCYEHNRNGRTMSIEVGKEILDDAFETVGCGDILTVDFFGGEPFIEFEKIKALVAYVKKAASEKRLLADYRFFATTNGTLIHGDIQDWLCDNPNFYLGLSLDGNRNMQNINRSGSFDRIDLDFFSTMYPEQPVKMTISSETLPYLATRVKFCHEKGFEVSCNLAYGMDWSNKLHLEELEQQLDILIEFYLKYPSIKPCSLLNRNITVVGSNKNKSTIQRWCGSGTAMRTFDCDGSQYPCQFFMPISCGKEKSEASKTICFYKDIPISLLDEKCRNCIVKECCPTCYGSNYVESGNIYHKDDAQCILEKKTFFENACFLLRRWERGQLSNVPENELLAMLIGAKRIIEEFQ